jgi:hypothetical protein
MMWNRQMKLKTWQVLSILKKCNPLIKIWTIVGEMEGSIHNISNLYICLKG